MWAGELATRLRALHATRRILLVAIDGAGGSGKSRLADDIRTRLTTSHVPTSIVEVDDFFICESGWSARVSCGCRGVSPGTARRPGSCGKKTGCRARTDTSRSIARWSARMQSSVAPTRTTETLESGRGRRTERLP